MLRSCTHAARPFFDCSAAVALTCCAAVEIMASRARVAAGALGVDEARHERIEHCLVAELRLAALGDAGGHGAPHHERLGPARFAAARHGLRGREQPAAHERPERRRNIARGLAASGARVTVLGLDEDAPDTPSKCAGSILCGSLLCRWLRSVTAVVQFDARRS